MDYRREIDGLRALAVLPVIFFHAGFETFRGGFVGVDIFFVISGYLITSIILAEKQAGTFTIINFYERRARRILPALFVVMLACLPFAWLWLTPADMRTFLKSLVAVSFFVSNIFFNKQADYFASDAELNPLLHTWSLAVEEQYYVFFPVFLMLAWRLGQRRIAYLLGVVAILSFSLAQWGVFSRPSSVFYLMPTRIWELLIGALIAFMFFNKGNRYFDKSVSQTSSMVGLLLITYAVLVFDKQTPFPGVYALVPTIGAGLIIIFASPQTLVGKLLGTRLFVGVGLVSYSAYLWHQPLFAFARHVRVDGPDKVQAAILATVAIVLAYFSWKYVETPFRNKRQFNRRQIFRYGAAGSALLVAIGLTGRITNGFDNRVSNEQRFVLSFEQYDYANAYRFGTCLLDPSQNYSDFKEDCRVGTVGNGTLIWGDSHAAALSFGLRKTASNVIQYTTGACPPIKDMLVNGSPRCKEINNYVLDEIKRLRPNKIYLHANWSLYDKQEPAKKISKTIEYIRSVSPSSQVTIVGSVPKWKPSLPAFMLRKQLKMDGEYYLANPYSDELTKSDQAFNKVAKENGVFFLSALNSLCPQGLCQVTTRFDQRLMPTAWDYGHLTEGGSVLLANKLVGRAL